MRHLRTAGQYALPADICQPAPDTIPEGCQFAAAIPPLAGGSKRVGVGGHLLCEDLAAVVLPQACEPCAEAGDLVVGGTRFCACPRRGLYLARFHCLW